jgi:mannose-6-phosphate isomerase-like protein (cupin superfamily)
VLVKSAALDVVDLGDEAGRLAPGLPSQVIARIDESCLRLSVFAGEGNWHSHPSTDELFLVLEGELSLDLEDGSVVTIGPRQIVTVPAGTVHRPRAAQPSTILCFKRVDAENEFHAGPSSGDG